MVGKLHKKWMTGRMDGKLHKKWMTGRMDEKASFHPDHARQPRLTTTTSFT
jgi:hypothetical protein